MSPASLAELLRRPAVRSFDPSRPIDRGTVASLIDAARWTGSARNRQPWRLMVIGDAVTLRSLASLGAYAGFLAEAPLAIVVASADDGFSDTEFDCGRLTQSLTLAAAEVGLGSCPATLYPSENVQRAQALLGLPAEWLPRHVLALGYPSATRIAPNGSPAVPRGRLGAEEITLGRAAPDREWRPGTRLLDENS